MKLKFSVIIPVYNEEQQIKKCIESVIEQKCNEIEIIIIDDGSTDNSLRICNEFKKNYTFISVISQKNQGLGAARNRGIDLAQGEYIVFVDSDDYLVENKLNMIYTLLIKKKVDLLGTVRNELDENGKILKKGKISEKIVKDKIINGRDYLRIHGCNYNPMVWQFIFSTDFIKRNRLYFYEGIYHEDCEFMTRVFLKAKKIYISNILFYNYCYCSSSITRKRNIKRCYDLIRVSELINETAKKEKSDKKIRMHLERYASYIAWESVHSCIIQNFNIKRFLSSNGNRKKIISNIKFVNKYSIIKIILYFHLENTLKITKHI